MSSICTEGLVLYAVPIRNAKEVAGMRTACRLAREILDKARAAVKPGVTTDEIDRIVSRCCTMFQAVAGLGNAYTILSLYMLASCICMQYCCCRFFTLALSQWRHA